MNVERSGYVTREANSETRELLGTCMEAVEIRGTRDLRETRDAHTSKTINDDGNDNNNDDDDDDHNAFLERYRHTGNSKINVHTISKLHESNTGIKS